MLLNVVDNYLKQKIRFRLLQSPIAAFLKF